jgi:hypothetical protein
MEVERYSGDFIVLRSTEEFEKLKKEFDSQETYEDKLLFWQSIRIFQQKLQQDSLYTKITAYEYYEISHSPAENEYISIEPNESELKAFIQWLIHIPDQQLSEQISAFERFDNKKVFLEARLKELEALINGKEIFREIFSAVEKDKVNEKVDALRAQARNERQLSLFVLTLRKALRWKAFLAVTDPGNTYQELLGIDQLDKQAIAKSKLYWKGDNNSLILLVKLLMETGYLEAPSFKQACEQLGLFLNKDLRNIYDAISKMYERTKRGYKNNLIKDLIDYEKKLRKDHGLTAEGE